MKKYFSILLAFIICIINVIPAFCANAESEPDSVEINIIADNQSPNVGDIITVSVLFESCPKNINTLEIIVPIDTEAFIISDDAPSYCLTKNSETVGDCAFRKNGSEACIIFIDVNKPLESS